MTKSEGVVALAPQTYGARLAGQLAPRPLLVVHGTADTRLPYTCGVRIYDWAQEPGWDLPANPILADAEDARDLRAREPGAIPQRDHGTLEPLEPLEGYGQVGLDPEVVAV